MTALEASSVRVRTMADGTLRAELDFEPRFAAAAFRLLGSPGQPVAVAALRIRPATQEAEAPKGGALAMLAGQWSQMEAFHRWADVVTDQQAADFIRTTCGVTSRALLDHDAQAAHLFHTLIREPFAAYLKENS